MYPMLLVFMEQSDMDDETFLAKSGSLLTVAVFLNKNTSRNSTRAILILSTVSPWLVLLKHLRWLFHLESYN